MYDTSLKLYHSLTLRLVIWCGLYCGNYSVVWSPVSNILCVCKVCTSFILVQCSSLKFPLQTLTYYDFVFGGGMLWKYGHRKLQWSISGECRTMANPSKFRWRLRSGQFGNPFQCHMEENKTNSHACSPSHSFWEYNVVSWQFFSQLSRNLLRQKENMGNKMAAEV